MNESEMAKVFGANQQLGATDDAAIAYAFRIAASVHTHYASRTYLRDGSAQTFDPPISVALTRIHLLRSEAADKIWARTPQRQQSVQSKQHRVHERRNRDAARSR